MATVRCLGTIVLVTQDKRLLKQDSHFSEVASSSSFQEFLRFFKVNFQVCVWFFHFQVVLKQKPANLSSFIWTKKNWSFQLYHKLKNIPFQSIKVI